MKKIMMLSAAFMLVGSLAFAHADGGKKGKKKAKQECSSEKSSEKKSCCAKKEASKD